MEHINGPMAGRTVLVTGATSGIGRATAQGLATMGAHVAITGRDRERTETAAREISAAGARNVEIFVADLSSQGAGATAGQRGTREPVADPCVGQQRRRVLEHPPRDRGWTGTHFALNHLAPFLLTNLLLDRLERSAPARVVTVASNAHARDALTSTTFKG